MTVSWNRIGPREKEVLTILRRANGGLATREVLARFDERGVDVAYTTVGTILDRLAAKDVLEREREPYAGSTRYRYRFEPAAHREDLIEDVVSDVNAVLGEEGLTLLKRRAETRSTRAEGP